MKVCLLGTEFYSDNRGCGALAYSAVNIVQQVAKSRSEDLEMIAILFNDRMVKEYVDKEGITLSTIKIQPKKIEFWKKCSQVFERCDCVLDFSMGDSFADIYGTKRFYLASVLKVLAIHKNSCFIMAPQTIGPFSKRGPICLAKYILKRSRYCFVRDSLSLNYMKSLVNRDIYLSTDVAFSLPYLKTEKAHAGKIRIGLNPSGLLWNGTEAFNRSKHITIDYHEYIRTLLKKWTEDDRYEVFLVPHVFNLEMVGAENDLVVCEELEKEFENATIVKNYSTPMEIKGFISGLDIFIGARMHATVAAFSSGVAVIPVSYSRKFEGLFYDLNYKRIICATKIGTKEAIQKTLEWVENYPELGEEIKVSQSQLRQKQDVFYDVLHSIGK